MSDSLVATLAKQGLAGFATIPSELMRGAAIVANPMRFARQLSGTATEQDRSRYGGAAQVLQGSADAANNWINRQLGIEDPSALDNTGEAVARFTGGALPTFPISAPLRLATAIQSVPSALRTAGAIPLKLAELLTPATITNAPTQVGRTVARAANVGVQTAASAGIEALTEPFDPTVAYTKYDADGNVVEEYTPAPSATPGAGRIVVRGVTEAVREQPALTGLAGLATVGAGLLARRAGRRATDIRETAATSDVIQPRDQTAADVPIIASEPRNAANRFAELWQDANIRTKDAVQQADPDKASARATRDAIDMVNEPAHKDRLISTLEDGVVITPRGPRQTESMRRLAEDLHHASLRDPETNKLTKELLGLETELDNRAYAVAKGQRDSVPMDINTFQKAAPGTPQSQIVMVTPRATLHHLSDQDLVRRIHDIRNTRPDAVQYADRYWKFHRDLADAWVDWGLVSKQERALWGRANPHFMHTINLDDAKSPRTYRIREHGSGPQHAGDPILAATEYADFMLAHVYRNRMRQRIVESLRAGAAANPGMYGNGKWLGRVAHPAEVRNRQVIDPRTGQLRAMRKDDIDITGDRISYYDNGELVDVEVRNKQLLHTLQTMPAHASTVLGWMRQLAQSGMTGNLATLTGQPFFLANAVMGAMAGMVNRPKGRAFGYLDQGAQAITGGRVGWRGDPTAVVGMVHAAGRDVSSILTRAVAESFRNSIAHNGLLSKIPNAQGIADTAARRYVESMYAANHRIGSGSASTLGNRDFDTAANRSTVINTVTPHGNTSRVISDPKDWKEIIQIHGQSIVPADVKIAARMFNDIQEAIGNMAQSYFFRQNYGKTKQLDDAARVPEVLYAREMAQAQPYIDRARVFRDQADAAKRANNPALARQLTNQAQQQQLMADVYIRQAEPHRVAANRAREEWYREYNSLGVATRQLLGDPAQMGTALRDLNKSGTTGTEKVAGQFINMTPYGNIGLQASGRLLRAAKENPVGTAAAIALTLGPLAILPIARAIMMDNERMARGEEPIYVPYELSRPAWDASRFAAGYIGGIDPDQSPRMRIDPLLSLPYTLFREALVSWLNLNGDPRLDPTVAYSRENILRISNDRSWNNITTAALNAQPFSQFPPIVGAAAAGVGVDLGTFEKLISRGSATPLPMRGQGGYENSRLAHDVTTKTFDAVIGQLLGGAGLTWVGAVRSGWQAERRERGTFAGAAFDELKGRAQDRLPEVQPLWDQPSRRASSDHLADMANAKEQAARRIAENITASRAPGTIGSGSTLQMDPSGGGRQGVADPEMRRLLETVVQFNSSMEPLRAERQLERTRMLSIEQEALPYADRRLRLNERSREINRINGELVARYTRFEDAISDRLGYRIRLEQIDPSKPITQFRPLTP